MSLISSSQDRLLAKVPRRKDVNMAIRDALLVMLVPKKAKHEEQAEKTKMRRSRRLLFLWQTPLMLMHYSWVTFLVGYELYLITPLIKHGSWTVQCTVSILSNVVKAVILIQRPGRRYCHDHQHSSDLTILRQ
jgi:uncharacterized membrane protein (DUF485 family)